MLFSRTTAAARRVPGGGASVGGMCMRPLGGRRKPEARSSAVTHTCPMDRAAWLNQETRDGSASRDAGDQG